MPEQADNYGQIESCFQEIKQALLRYLAQKDLNAISHSLKSKREIVTEIDQEVEALIVDLIVEHCPGNSIVGEEGTRVEGIDPYTWYIDPVDNTVGLVAGESEVSTSVSLKYRDEHIYSLVLNLKSGDAYEANREGSSRNNQPISSFEGSLDDKTRGLSTCAYVNKLNIKKWQQIMEVLLMNRLPLRISGGAALDLCHIAEGKSAAHVSLGAHLWDVEAGFHLVKSAGGIVEVLQVFPDRNSVAFIVSANAGIHRRIKKLLGQLILFSDES